MTIKKDLTTVNFTSKSSRDIKGIVLHSMWGTQSGSIAWFKNPDAKASAHYCISKTGQIVQCVEDKDIAWHAGIFDEPIADWLKPNPNNVTIGIELEDERNSEWIYPQPQIDALKWLIERLCTMYDIPQDSSHILLHKNLNPSRRTDPVGNFDLGWVLSNSQPENILLKVLDENDITTEGQLREVIGHHKDYPVITRDLENCRAENERLKDQLARKNETITNLNNEIMSMNTEMKELRQSKEDFLTKLLKRLNPLNSGNDEATVLGEIDKLLTMETTVENKNIEISDLKSQIITLKKKLEEKCPDSNHTVSSLWKSIWDKLRGR